MLCLLMSELILGIPRENGITKRMEEGYKMDGGPEIQPLRCAGEMGSDGF